ncbi:DNA-directed RNA polymerase subunit omega [Rhodoligotrophos ferricapiens]|uniref:DNA-directed RNA polymerase subunit omega n=1 Tax=Rhodoligotrophos ferricapiens TaxID=3069264 RepID=UPI00315D959B
MDPFVVFDCAKVLPNRFALTLAAAARGRALRRGAEPRSDRLAAGAGDLALHEIAEGAFTRAELGLFLEEPSGPQLLPRPSAQDPDLRGGASPESAAAPVSRFGETAH